MFLITARHYIDLFEDAVGLKHMHALDGITGMGKQCESMSEEQNKGA
jgi:hypothetical protein